MFKTHGINEVMLLKTEAKLNLTELTSICLKLRISLIEFTLKYANGAEFTLSEVKPIKYNKKNIDLTIAHRTQLSEICG